MKIIEIRIKFNSGNDVRAYNDKEKVIFASWNQNPSLEDIKELAKESEKITKILN